MSIHASCFLIGRCGEAFGAPFHAGVLLLGESGAGKSDLCLRLIERGALLVADDRVELFLHNGTLHARSAATLKGLLEIRNVGIVEVPYAEQAQIALAVVLERCAPATRLTEPEWYELPSGLDVPQDARPPLLRLDGTAPSTPAKILAAVAAHAQARFRDGRTPAPPSFPAGDLHPRARFRNTQ